MVDYSILWCVGNNTDTQQIEHFNRFSLIKKASFSSAPAIVVKNSADESAFHCA